MTPGTEIISVIGSDSIGAGIARAASEAGHSVIHIEIDPHKYYPDDVYREPLTELPEDLAFTKADIEAMIAARPDSS